LNLAVNIEFSGY